MNEPVNIASLLGEALLGAIRQAIREESAPSKYE
jgi:hypothetical protein